MATAERVEVAAEPGSKGNPMLPLRVVARRLGVSMETVRRMRKRGDFPGAQKIRACWKIPEHDVLQVARGGSVTIPDHA